MASKFNYWQKEIAEIFLNFFWYINITAFCGLSLGVALFPENFEDIFDGIGVSALGINQFLKYILLRHNSKKLKNIIAKLPQNYSKDDDKRYGFTRKLKNYRTPFVIFGVTLFIGIIRNTWSHLRIKKFMFGFRFPFDTTNVQVFYACTAWVYVVGNLICPIIIFNENFIFGLISVLIVELEKLKNLIFELRVQIFLKNRQQPDALNLRLLKVLDSPIGCSISDQIIKIINKHVQLLDIRDELEEIFAPIFLLNLICGSLCLCFEEFHAILADNIPHKAMLLMVGASQCLAVFVQCYYCQQLKDASLSISDAIYDSNWEEIMDEKVKKHLMMILIRSQKSRTFTCWKFAENSFELFGSVKKKIRNYC